MNRAPDNVIALRRHPDGVAGAIRSVRHSGRYEVVTAGRDPERELIGGDPWDTNVGTGLVIPATPSSEIGNARYLFLLARASFGTGEQSSTWEGTRLVGIRQYVDLVARIPARTAPLATDSGPPVGATVTFRKEIESALWHPFDGNISWHVMVIGKTQRQTRNPLNADSVIFQDAKSPALLFETLAPYTPPNDGRPWGLPVGASLGNIHELRYRWRDKQTEQVFDIPIPAPCDVALFASVRQNDPTLNPTLDVAADCGPFGALCPEDQFVVAYPTFAQYGSIAGALVFEDNLGREVP